MIQPSFSYRQLAVRLLPVDALIRQLRYARGHDQGIRSGRRHSDKCRLLRSRCARLNQGLGSRPKLRTLLRDLASPLGSGSSAVNCGGQIRSDQIGILDWLVA